MASIHPTALVERGAELAEDVAVGAFSVIDGGVSIGAGTRVGHHVVITGETAIGARNRIWHYCSIGEAPQDKKYGEEPTRLVIGNDNTIREFCTFNRGTSQDRAVTEIGSHNWIMAYVHIAHDCVVGNHTVFANSAQLAGHVIVGDHATLGGMSGVHQFCRVGAHAMVAAGSVIFQDIPPFMTVGGNPLRVAGINSEGLRRRGFTPDQILSVKRAFKTLYRSGLSLEDARAALAQAVATQPEIAPLVEFLEAPGRGIIR